MASGDWRIVGRGSSLYGVFKSAKNTEHSFLCDPQGKRERGPALLATPGLEASPRGQREPLKGLGLGGRYDRICVFKDSCAAEEKGWVETARRTCGRPVGGCCPSGRWWLLGRGMGRSGTVL